MLAYRRIVYTIFITIDSLYRRGIACSMEWNLNEILVSIGFPFLQKFIFLSFILLRNNTTRGHLLYMGTNSKSRTSPSPSPFARQKWMWRNDKTCRTVLAEVRIVGPAGIPFSFYFFFYHNAMNRLWRMGTGLRYCGNTEAFWCGINVNIVQSFLGWFTHKCGMLATPPLFHLVNVNSKRQHLFRLVKIDCYNIHKIIRIGCEWGPCKRHHCHVAQCVAYNFTNNQSTNRKMLSVTANAFQKPQ